MPRASTTSRDARSLLGGIFDYAEKKERLTEVLRELEEPDVWSDPERAQSLGRERASLELVVETIDTLEKGLADAADLLAMAAEEGDDETVFLAPLEEILARGETLAEMLLKRYENEWNRDIDRLFEAYAY